MKTLSAETLEAVKKATAASVQEMETGKSVREIVKDIYCTLPDKSEEIGYRMADHFALLVEEYHSSVDECLENQEKYLDEQLAAAVAGKSNADACAAYHRMLTAIAAGMIINQADPADPAAVAAAEEEARRYVQEQNGNQDYSSATVEQVNELAAAVKKSLIESKLVVAQLPQLLLEMQDESLDTATIVPEFGRKSKALKMLLSAQAYVSAKQGTLEGIDPNVSMRDVTFMTCGAVDTCAVAAGLEEGSITEERAKKIMDVIGVVLGTALVVGAGFVLITFTANFIISLFSITSFVGTLIALLLGWTAMEGVLTDKVVGVIYKVSLATAHAVGFAVGMAAGVVWRGLQKLASVIKAGAGQILDSVKAFVARIREKTSVDAPVAEYYPVEEHEEHEERETVQMPDEAEQPQTIAAEPALA